MTVLTPMRLEVYAEYISNSIAGYAEDNVSSGRWPMEGSLERSTADFKSLLPQGIETPNNYLFQILTEYDGPTVGFIWLAVLDQHGFECGFIYDVEIKQEYRRNGYAERAFHKLEKFAVGLGLSNISLHVFKHNTGAQALYTKLGYSTTGISMHKNLCAMSEYA